MERKIDEFRTVEHGTRVDEGRIQIWASVKTSFPLTGQGRAEICLGASVPHDDIETIEEGLAELVNRLSRLNESLVAEAVSGDAEEGDDAEVDLDVY